MSNPMEEQAEEENQEDYMGGEAGAYLGQRPFVKSELLDLSSPELEDKGENAFLQNYTQLGINEPLPNINTTDVFSPSSTSSQNWRTPTLKVEDHDGWQEMLEPSPVSNDQQPQHQQRRYLSTAGFGHDTDAYSSDLDSDYGASVYHTPNLRPHDPSASPAMSYLTTGDDEVDDLLSVRSGVSNTNSNCMLPKNSQGYKHVTNMNELDNLLTMINDHFDLEFNDLGQSPVPNELSFRGEEGIQPQNAFPPVISIQEVPGQQPEFFKRSQSSPSPEETTHLQRQLQQPHEQHHGSLLCPSDNLSDASYEEMRNGRIMRRRSSRRSSRASRSSSISPDEKARSLSEDSDRLLELADLQPPSPIPSSRNSSNQSSSNNNNNVQTHLLEEGETLQNLSGSTKKRLSQKNPATYACELCDKRFTRPYNLKSHLRTHTNERPFECSICGKAFARQHDRKRHEDLHTGKKRYVCGGILKNGSTWGCGKKFARSDALGRHFKTESGRKCIVPLYEEASREKGFVPELPEQL